MNDRRDDEARGPSAIPVCRLLRTKTSFGTTAGDHTWRSGESITAAYWCLSTMQTAGPDDALAHPHACREGRGCFQSPGE